MAGMAGEHMTGMLLAAPSGWQFGGGLESHPGVDAGDLPDNRGRLILGMVIENDDFLLNTSVCEDGADRLGDSRLLVAGGDQH